jgi:hypothetical protein
MQFLKFQRAISGFQWKRINLRAAGALLIFLLSWMAVPAAMLAHQDSEEFCSMECCVADGHCCCAAAKPFVEGKDYSDVPKFASPELASQCPCPVTPPSSSKLAHGQIAPNQSRNLAVVESSLQIQCVEQTLYNSPQLSPNSSRAPPVTLI